MRTWEEKSVTFARDASHLASSASSSLRFLLPDMFLLSRIALCDDVRSYEIFTFTWLRPKVYFSCSPISRPSKMPRRVSPA